MNEKSKQMLKIDPEVRDQVLKSLSKAGDLSTNSIAISELKLLNKQLYTPVSFKTFISYITQTTSLQPLLQRKTTFLILDDLIQVHTHKITPYFNQILTYLLKRSQDPEITLTSYQQQVSQSFEQLTILSNSSEKHQQTLYQELSLTALKQSFCTKIIALSSILIQIQFSIPFNFISEAGNLAIQTAKNYHDSIRNRLQMVALEIINSLLEIGYFHPQIAEIALKSIYLKFHKTREVAFQILEKLLILGYFEDNVEQCQKIYKKISTLRYDQVADVRIAGFSCYNVFQEFLQNKIPDWMEQQDPTNSRSGSKCSFREFRNRIQTVSNQPLNNSIKNQKLEKSQKSFQELTQQIIPIVENKETLYETVENVFKPACVEIPEQPEEKTIQENSSTNGSMTQSYISQGMNNINMSGLSPSRENNYVEPIEETCEDLLEESHQSTENASESSKNSSQQLSLSNNSLQQPSFIEDFTPERQISQLPLQTSSKTQYFGDILAFNSSVNTALFSPSNPSKLIFESNASNSAINSNQPFNISNNQPQQQSYNFHPTTLPNTSQTPLNPSQNDLLLAEIQTSQRQFQNKKSFKQKPPTSSLERQLSKFCPEQRNLEVCAKQKIKVSRTFVPQHQSNIGAQALHLVERGRVLEAYDLILSEESLGQKRCEKEVLQVMNRTGPCLQMLDDELIQKVIVQVVKMLKDGFIDQMLDWVRQVLSKRHLLKFEQASQILASLGRIWKGHVRWNEVEQLKQEIYLYYPQLDEV